VARFILGQLPEGYTPAAPVTHSPADDWIMAKLNTAVTDVTGAIEDYRFSEAGQLVYSLLWDDFADWYVEAAKVSPNHDVLVYGLETILKLAHPIAPFITEAIWSSLKWQTGQLITEAWPVANKNRTSATEFEAAKTVIQAIRTISAEEQLTKPVLLTTRDLVMKSSSLITRLARVAKVKLVKQGSGLYLGTGSEWIEADNARLHARKARLKAQRQEKKQHLVGLEAKLGNERYVQSAPAAVVQETRDRREEALMLISKLDEQLADLS